MQIVTPGQFVVFARNLDGGASCDLDGRAHPDPEQATCVVCDALDEARALAEAAVAKAPAMRVDIFDFEGRANPPLLTIVHPSRARESETHPRALGRRAVIAWVLIAGAIPLLVFAYVMHRDRDIILPAFIGINMVIAGARLLWLNLAVRETERVRQARLDRLGPRDETTRPRVG